MNLYQLREDIKVKSLELIDLANSESNIDKFNIQLELIRELKLLADSIENEINQDLIERVSNA